MRVESENLLESLASARGLGFEDVIRRSVVLYKARELPEAEARAFYRAALEASPVLVKMEIARELEWWRFADFRPILESLQLPGFELQIDALAALSDDHRCVCDVYAEHGASTASPLMEQLRERPPKEPQIDEHDYRCTECGKTLVHRQEHHERGATRHTWRTV